MPKHITVRSEKKEKKNFVNKEERKQDRKKERKKLILKAAREK